MNFIGGYCKHRGPESQKSVKKLAWRASWNSWEPVEASWEPLGSLLGCLGASWEPLEASWERLGTFLGRLNSVLGASWDVLGASWEVLGIILEPSWEDFLNSKGTREASWKRLS